MGFLRHANWKERGIRFWIRSRPADHRGRQGARPQGPVDLHLPPPEPLDRAAFPGLPIAEETELAAARRRIAELDTELRATRRAMQLVRE